MDTSTFIVSSGGAAVVSSLFIQYLKKSKLFTFLSTKDEAAKANFYFSVFIAGLTSVGLSYTYNPDTGQLIVNGLILQNIVHSLGHWFLQWVAQHVAYKQFVVPSEMQSQILNYLDNLIQQQEKKL